MNQLKNIGVNLFGYGYWGNKINSTLKHLGIPVNIIDPKLNTTIDDANPNWPAIIATPTPAHFELALELINQNYNVMIEKPVAMNVEQIVELHNATKLDQIVMPGHLYMFNTMFDQFKDEIKKLGNPKFIHCVRTNFGRYQTNVDALHNIAFHDLTILLDMFKNFEITQTMEVDLSNNQVADRYLVLGKCDNIPFQIEASWLSPTRQRTITYYGDKGQAVWNSDKNLIEVTNFTIDPFEKTTQIVLPLFYETPLEKELKEFMWCVENKVQPKVQLRDALLIEILINKILTNRN